MALPVPCKGENAVNVCSVEKLIPLSGQLWVLQHQHHFGVSTCWVEENLSVCIRYKYVVRLSDYLARSWQKQQHLIL